VSGVWGLGVKKSRVRSRWTRDDKRKAKAGSFRLAGKRQTAWTKNRMRGETSLRKPGSIGGVGGFGSVLQAGIHPKASEATAVDLLSGKRGQFEKRGGRDTQRRGSLISAPCNRTRKRRVGKERSFGKKTRKKVEVPKRDPGQLRE